ncbi:MAG: BREX-1 system adenine-specific DNA-methyltransferase PglX [Bacilli bacterium]|nr:BREX-1 system adenine-specific DNA-methyltransferase PglX [Bacilli bacterium]
MFERIANYTELLFPNGLLKKGSIIDRLVSDIAEEDWKEQVQIIGWMYQFYISKKKDEVFASKKTITKNTIGAVTQLFTPDWIVRYMAENSIGRIWLESYPNSSIKSEMKYYVEDAEQEADVKAKLEEIRYKDVNPEDIKVIEPCCGSGHIMVYCFDLLYKMYIEKGYAPKDIATLILKNNIWGLDIDKRASQLAYFSVMMKARSVDRQFLTRDIVQQPRVYEIVDSQPILQFDYEELLTTYKFTSKSISTAKYLVSTFKYAKVIGSLLIVNRYDYRDLLDEINQKMKEVVPDIISGIAWQVVLPQLKRLGQLAMVLSRKYDVMITNPPYLKSSVLENPCKEYSIKYYPDSKEDMFAMFMDTSFVKKNGYLSMINMQGWMGIASFKNLRKKLIAKSDLINALHLGAHAFESLSGEVVKNVCFVIRNSFVDYNGTIFDLVPFSNGNRKENAFLSKSCKKYNVSWKYFLCLENAWIVYRLSRDTINILKNSIKLKDTIDAVKGLDTCDNDTFVREWFEVNLKNISFDTASTSACNNIKWYPYAKGGGSLKWFGLNTKVVNWQDDGQVLRNLRDERGKIKSRPQNTKYYFRKGLTFSAISGKSLALRYLDNSIFGGGGCGVFVKGNESIYQIQAYLNSDIPSFLLEQINPSLNYLVGDILELPFPNGLDEKIDDIVKENIDLAKILWNKNETAPDFKKNILLSTKSSSIEHSVSKVLQNLRDVTNNLLENEEKINNSLFEYFVISELDNKTNQNYFDYSEKSEIISMILYIFGVSFGRYSLDHEGLCYAGGDWDSSLYSTIIPDGNNIIPILDDGYYADDATNKVVEFVTKVYGQDTLDENLKFIADSLGGNGTSKEVIRNYLLSGFYSDHLKTYQKRPIYWLFDAGKQNSFKALIYMHRYTPDLLAKMRTDYILPLMDKYSSRIEFLEREIPTLTGVQATKSRKELEKVKAQLKEISEYEPKIHHLADERISIDLDDGVKHNYELFKDVLAPIQ